MHTCFDSIHIKIFVEKSEIAACIINVWGYTEILPCSLSLWVDFHFHVVFTSLRTADVFLVVDSPPPPPLFFSAGETNADKNGCSRRLSFYVRSHANFTGLNRIHYVEPRSTFTFTRGLLYIASTLFTR